MCPWDKDKMPNLSTFLIKFSDGQTRQMDMSIRGHLLAIFFPLLILNPLLHRYSFLRLLQQTTLENIVAKEEIAPTKLSNLKMFISFSRVHIQDLSKCRLLQDCCMGERVNSKLCLCKKIKMYSITI